MSGDPDGPRQVSQYSVVENLGSEYQNHASINGVLKIQGGTALATDAQRSRLA